MSSITDDNSSETKEKNKDEVHITTLSTDILGRILQYLELRLDGGGPRSLAGTCRHFLSVLDWKFLLNNCQWYCMLPAVAFGNNASLLMDRDFLQLIWPYVARILGWFIILFQRHRVEFLDVILQYPQHIFIRFTLKMFMYLAIDRDYTDCVGKLLEEEGCEVHEALAYAIRKNKHDIVLYIKQHDRVQACIVYCSGHPDQPCPSQGDDRIGAYGCCWPTEVKTRNTIVVGFARRALLIVTLYVQSVADSVRQFVFSNLISL